jgi:Uncharacterized protein conserved in bacteria
MAEYAVFLYAPTDNVGATPEESARELAEHHRHAEELESTGTMVFARALAGTEASTSLRAESITDGPFLDTKEMSLGFYVISAENLDEALAIAKRNPILHQGGGLEVRPMAS